MNSERHGGGVLGPRSCSKVPGLIAGPGGRRAAEQYGHEQYPQENSRKISKRGVDAIRIA
ncbi:hypothetical protein [Streptomyces sp. GC420]|uniref:hypothetical protein n=1 Tax=Streptomyces sp. GC420 TaxID=2697568 RepID=UPI0014150F90|nr:hypothetical protein [Streptomyces sp. GC420]NBM14718.1 hypothetical protein [Streptomyces sp. GC420]